MWLLFVGADGPWLIQENRPWGSEEVALELITELEHRARRVQGAGLGSSCSGISLCLGVIQIGEGSVTH